MKSRSPWLLTARGHAQVRRTALSSTSASVHVLASALCTVELNLVSVTTYCVITPHYVTTQQSVNEDNRFSCFLHNAKYYIFIFRFYNDRRNM